jgi:hypothetical protein
MCEKCTELDFKMAHCKRLAISVTDQLASEGIAQLIKRMGDEKVALHEPNNRSINS